MIRRYIQKVTGYSRSQVSRLIKEYQQPGYIRIDTIHQGDIDDQKGVYHINAVDEVTQWEIVVSVEMISEAYLIQVLENILVQFPFIIRGFRSDNRSEFINKTVVALLNKLLFRFTRSRARCTTDNGLE